MDVEIWKAVPGEHGYEVSNLGRVRSYRHRRFSATRAPVILEPVPQHNGYLRVMLYPGRRRFPVGHLVLLAFVGPCPHGFQCRHFPDRDVTNNRLENLQWGTVQENHDDMKVHGTRPRGSKHGTHTVPASVRRGSQNGNSRLTEADVLEIRRLLRSKLPMYRIAAKFGVSKPTIRRVRDGLTWAHLKSTA